MGQADQKLGDVVVLCNIEESLANVAPRLTWATLWLPLFGPKRQTPSCQGAVPVLRFDNTTGITHIPTTAKLSTQIIHNDPKHIVKVTMSPHVICAKTITVNIHSDIRIRLATIQALVVQLLRSSWGLCSPIKWLICYGSSWRPKEPKLGKMVFVNLYHHDSLIVDSFKHNWTTSSKDCEFSRSKRKITHDRNILSI